MSTPAASSSTTTRCAVDRLHRDQSLSPDLDECKKRKRQATAQNSDHSAVPTPKKRRGRPAKTATTPSSTRYALRSQGQLPTPEASQRHTPDTEDGSEDTDVEASSTSAQPRTPDQSQEPGDTIVVNNSTITSSRNSDDALDQLHTPDDTSIVYETPLQEQPGLEVADVQDHMFPFARRGADSENPFLGNSPIDNHFSRRLGSMASAREVDNIHYTTRGDRDHRDRDYQAEADGLRASRTALREHLEASTALVHTLQTRLLQNEGNTLANRALLTQAQADLAEARARVQDGRSSVVRLASTLAVFVFSVAAYAVWTWVNGPEMEYIRKRRADVLME